MSKVVDGLESADSGCDLEMYAWKTQVRSPNVFPVNPAKQGPVSVH
jgi:hypothetical protein